MRRVKLNRETKLSLAIQGIGNCLCSATGNCEFWIYQESYNGNFRLLLHASGVQQFKFQRSMTNGYLDVVTYMHGSATESDISVYQFNGVQYQLKECLHRSYTNSSRRHSTKPTITHVSCDLRCGGQSD